jgi:hypothetical protein
MSREGTSPAGLRKRGHRDESADPSDGVEGDRRGGFSPSKKVDAGTVVTGFVNAKSQTEIVVSRSILHDAEERWSVSFAVPPDELPAGPPSN